jgi:4-carboxymuconolactone decarboxylase
MSLCLSRNSRETIDTLAGGQVALLPMARDRNEGAGTVTNNRYERGLARLAEIDGKLGEAVIADLAPDLGRYIVEFGFGDVYSRPGLDLKTRELATVAGLVAMGHCEPQLKVHLSASMNVGATQEEIVEIIIQMSLYAGFPASLKAIVALREVLATHDQVAPARSPVGA